jgi:hypothetical protein
VELMVYVRHAPSVFSRAGELLNPMRNQERQMMASNPRWRLACKAVVGFGMQEGEMTVRVNPRQWDDFVEPEY